MGALLAVGLSVALVGCSNDSEPVLAPPLDTGPTAPTEYDPELEPARAVLPLVPAEATTLEVTDYDRVRLELGVGELTGESPAGERAAFWQRAGTASPLLSEGLLKPDEPALEAEYGLTQDDVSWEAHFVGDAGEGWVVKLRDDLPVAGVERAVSAGAGPFAGAEVDAENLLVLNGAAADTDSSWAVEDDLAALVGDAAAQATYVARECVAAEPAGDTTDLTDLGAYSVAFGGKLVTVRLGEGRTDAFPRSRLTDPAFERALTDPVADPGTGRLGYRLTDAALAADLARGGRLPFAVCAG